MITPSHVIERGDLVDRVLSSTFTPHQVIGKGGYGIVYRMPNSSDLVLKVTPIHGPRSETFTPRSFVSPQYHRGSVEYNGHKIELKREEKIKFRLAETERQTNALLSERLTAQERERIVNFNGGFYIQTDEGLYQVLILERIKSPTMAHLLDLETTSSLLAESVGIIKKGTDIPHPEVYRLVSSLIRTQEVLAKYGVVHKDLKPENIFVSKKGTKILDFGAAQVRGIEQRGELIASLYEDNAINQSMRGRAWGTPPYLSPENSTGKALSTANDIWSIGLITFELFALDATTMFPLPAEQQPLHHQSVYYHTEVIKGMWGGLLANRGVPLLAIEALEQMLQYDPKKRSTHLFSELAQRVLSS